MIRIGVLASGRGSNLQALLDACRDGRINGRIAVVVTDKADAYALQRARQAGVEALFLDPAAYESKAAYDEALAGTLVAHGVDLVCLAGFMRLLRSSMVSRFGGRCLNIHPSLLPAFPGLHAQQQALEHGAKVAGCTVHFVSAGMDTGPIVLQAAVPVKEGDTVDSLSARILEQEHLLYPQAVALFAEGRLRIEGRRVLVG